MVKASDFQHINQFKPNAPFLYPLKTSASYTVFLCFQKVEKGCIGKEWIKLLKSEFKTSMRLIQCSVAHLINT